MSKKKNSQVIMKQDSSINWKKCENKYIPAINTIIIYNDGKQPLIKIADGIHLLGELPFINDIANAQKSTPQIIDGDVLEFK